MFEINLVPDIKEQLLKKQRMRNFVIFLSIVVAAGSAAVVLVLGSIVGGQSIVIGGQDREIQCRSEGPNEEVKTCDPRWGTPVMKIANLSDYLTIQDQMSRIGSLNENKMLLSRVFGVLDVVLLDGDERIDVSELAVNLPLATLSFDAQGRSVSQNNYKALEVFKNVVSLSYYDFGRYMRFDKEADDFVEIPTYCMDEMVEKGVAYGVYRKGAPGCEVSILARERVKEGEDIEEEEEGEEIEIIEVKIKRSYKSKSEQEAYLEEKNEADDGRYYFKSACMAYKEDEVGKIDEEKTREACRLAVEPLAIRDSQNARDSEGNLVLSFSATMMLNREIFRFANKHMRIVGPTRQNVTDSYTQIRNMFAEAATKCDDSDEQCKQETR